MFFFFVVFTIACFCCLSAPPRPVKRNAQSPLAAVSTGTLATSTGLTLQLGASNLLSLEQSHMCGSVIRILNARKCALVLAFIAPS